MGLQVVKRITTTIAVAAVFAGLAPLPSASADLAAPTGFVSTGSTASSLSLDWNDVAGAPRYSITMSKSSSFSSASYHRFVASQGTISGLSANTTYYMKVRVVSASEPAQALGPFSTTISPKTALTAPPPGAPTGFVSTGSTATTLSLDWNDVAGAPRYSVTLSKSSSLSSATYHRFVASQGTISGLSANTTYYMKVRVVSASDPPQSLGPLSATISAKTSPSAPPPPVAPTGLTVTGKTSTTLDVNWNDVAGAPRYSVAIADNPSFSGSSDHLFVASQGTIGGLSANTTYYLRVKVVTAADPAQDLGPYSATISATTSGITPPPGGDEHDYSNESPYGSPVSTVKTPPAGYHMIFVETIARHGARPHTSASSEEDVLDIWEQAEDAGALTSVGRTLAGDIRTFQAAERQVGYGKLSGLGRETWQGIGGRTEQTYEPFFDQVVADGDRIDTLTSSVTRTKQSADALHTGLLAGNAELDTPLQPRREADGILRISNNPTSAGQAIINNTLGSAEIRGHADALLETLYTPSFVNDIDNPVDAALDVYLLYATAAGMVRETDITFESYVPQALRERLSYMRDVDKFFAYGPGVVGETGSYSDARPLLADFFKALDNRIAGSSTAAVFRLSHGEVTIPFDALIKAPGSEKQVPKGGQFTRETNPWRGAIAGKLSGNIEWSAFRNNAGTVLVTMRRHEQPVRFHDGCVPAETAGYFYTPAELKRCLG